MVSSLTLWQKKKIAIILLIFSFTVSILVHKGSIDEFAPATITVVQDVANKGTISMAGEIVPGFYALGATIVGITGLQAEELLFLPIQLIPLILAFFLLFYKLSSSYIFAGLLILVEFMSALTNSGKVSLWPHGIAYVALFLTLYLIIRISENKGNNGNVSKFFFVTIILDFSLVFMSYDITALLMIFLAVFALVYGIAWFSQRKTRDRKESGDTLLHHKIFTLFLILFITEFGLSTFFYQTYLPTMRRFDLTSMSGIDKFFLSYISPTGVSNPLSDLYLNYPLSISVISGLKYGLLLVSILFFLFIIFRRAVRKKGPIIGVAELLVLGFILASGIYAVPRLLLGGLIITALYYPGVFSISRLFTYSNVRSMRKWAIAVLAALLVLAPAYYVANYSANTVNADPHDYAQLKTPSAWFWQYKDGRVASSDEMTKNLFIMYAIENRGGSGTKNLTELGNGIQLLTADDMLFLLQRGSDVHSRKIFVINENLNTIMYSNWAQLKPWSYSNNALYSNEKLDKVYTGAGVGVFLESGS